MNSRVRSFSQYIPNAHRVKATTFARSLYLVGEFIGEVLCNVVSSTQAELKSFLANLGFWGGGDSVDTPLSRDHPEVQRIRQLIRECAKLNESHVDDMMEVEEKEEGVGEGEAPKNIAPNEVETLAKLIEISSSRIVNGKLKEELQKKLGPFLTVSLISIKSSKLLKFASTVSSTLYNFVNDKMHFMDAVLFNTFADEMTIFNQSYGNVMLQKWLQPYFREWHAGREWEANITPPKTKPGSKKSRKLDRCQQCLSSLSGKYISKTSKNASQGIVFGRVVFHF